MASYIYVTETGTILPDTSQIQSEVIAEYKLAFGEDLITDPFTVQGIMITAETTARISVARNNCAVANQINPNIAGGIFLDATFALMGGKRNPRKFTTVFANLTGVPSTVIAAGSFARDSSNDIQYESLDTVTLNIDGEANDVEFVATISGPITLAPGDLDQIVSSVIGWETITNPDSGTPGEIVQSDASTKNLRKATLGLQGNSQALATLSALYSTPGVKSAEFRENVTNGTITIEGVTLVAHSIYCCVDGGTELDVATAILSAKSAGANYNGDITQEVTDPSSGQIYEIKFSRPEVIVIFVRATVRPGTSVEDVSTSVRAAIIAYANGEIAGEAGLGVGDDVSPFELSGGINILSPGIFVKKVEIHIEDEEYSTDIIPILISQVASITENNIVVVIE